MSLTSQHRSTHFPASPLSTHSFQRSPYTSRHLHAKQAVSKSHIPEPNLSHADEYQDFTVLMGSLAGRRPANGEFLSSASPTLNVSSSSMARVLNFSMDESHVNDDAQVVKRKVSHDTKRMNASDLSYAPHKTPQKGEESRRATLSRESRKHQRGHQEASVLDHLRNDIIDNLTSLNDKSALIEQSITDIRRHSARVEANLLKGSTPRATASSEDTTRWQHVLNNTPPVRPAAARTPALEDSGLPSVSLNIVNTPHTKTRRVVNHRSAPRATLDDSLHHTTSSLSLDDFQNSHNARTFENLSLQINGSDALHDEELLTTTSVDVDVSLGPVPSLSRPPGPQRQSKANAQQQRDLPALSQLKFYHETRNRLMKQLRTLRAQENLILEQLDVNAKRVSELLE